jgi:hypothetical protein
VATRTSALADTDCACGGTVGGISKLTRKSIHHRWQRRLDGRNECGDADSPTTRNIDCGGRSGGRGTFSTAKPRVAEPRRRLGTKPWAKKTPVAGSARVFTMAKDKRMGGSTVGAGANLERV